MYTKEKEFFRALKQYLIHHISDRFTVAVLKQMHDDYEYYCFKNNNYCFL